MRVGLGISASVALAALAAGLWGLSGGSGETSFDADPATRRSAAGIADPGQATVFALAETRSVEVVLVAGLPRREIEWLEERGARFERALGHYKEEGTSTLRVRFRATPDGVEALRAHPSVALVSGAQRREGRKVAAPLRSATRWPARVTFEFGRGVPKAKAERVMRDAGLDPVEVGPGRFEATATRNQMEDVASDSNVVGVDTAQRPVTTWNLGAAGASGIDEVRALGNLYGDGVILALWDGGRVRQSHVELQGRVLSNTSGPISKHATYVAGTLGASGVDPNAQGMAPHALLRGYKASGFAFGEWTVAKENFDLCNNSWGFVAGWGHFITTWIWYGPGELTEDPDFGKYVWSCVQADTATQYDDLLAVSAAGNSRGTVGPAPGETHKHWSEAGDFTDWHQPSNFEGGYDTLPTFSSSKNVLVVGAVDYGQSNVSSSGGWFSSWGPTDDGRIKPDIVARGVNVYSSWGASDDSYYTGSGTSASSPVVAGGLGLIVEAFRTLGYGSDYRPPASLLRALAIHSAKDLETTGPDPKTGYGMFDAGAAYRIVEHDAALGRWKRIFHETLQPGETDEFLIEVAQGEEFKATLVWADPPGEKNIEGVDDPAPAIVYDLDVRVVAPDGTVHEPWRIDLSDPAAPATKGDNSADTVERVDLVAAAPGTYVVRVSSKTPIVDARKYSLVVGDVTESSIPPEQPPVEEPVHEPPPEPVPDPSDPALYGGGGGGGSGCHASIATGRSRSSLALAVLALAILALAVRRS